VSERGKHETAGPHLVVIAGPNGAGKSTAAPTVLRGALHVDEFVNADVIARGLSEFHPESVALAAGKMMLARLRELAEQRRNFAFETTLASRTFAPWIGDLTQQGYSFHLIYFWLPAPDLSIARVDGRVRMGGHFVPNEVIRRRYYGGIRNFFELYRPLTETWRVYNNSSQPRSRLIASGGGPEHVKIYRREDWAAFTEASKGPPHTTP
jgi:predicted ABC-type ATPase